MSQSFWSIGTQKTGQGFQIKAEIEARSLAAIGFRGHDYGPHALSIRTHSLGMGCVSFCLAHGRAGCDLVFDQKYNRSALVLPLDKEVTEAFATETWFGNGRVHLQSGAVLPAGAQKALSKAWIAKKFLFQKVVDFHFLR